MFMAFISWWYGAGWRQQAESMRRRILGVVDMFSIDLLLKTLFMPFRQISAEQVDGPVNLKLHAFFDKLISRLIGAVVRLITVITGILVLGIYLVISLLMLALWPLVPLLPVIGVVLTMGGWLPWTA